MSNQYSWDDFVTEAEIQPYELKVSADKTIVIDNPSGAALMHISSGMRNGDLEFILVNLCGDSWPDVQELVQDAPHGVLPSLVESLMDHFDLYEPITLIGPGGGKVVRRKPREIRAMMNQGYRPMGETAASRG